MAITAGKLYPPTLNGTLPPFYEETTGAYEGAVFITVPFVMNRTVALNTIKGFMLKIKNATTDIDIGIIYSNEYTYTVSEKQVRFYLPPMSKKNDPDEETRKKVIIHGDMEHGFFYKLQLAYVGLDNTIGYYSTVGIAKYTKEASVIIQNLKPTGANVNQYVYTGEYHCEDYTERVFEYRFQIFDVQTNEVIETTGWTAHNTLADDKDGDPYGSTDTYNIKWDINNNSEYYIQYEVRTINNMELATVKYLLTGTESVAATLDATLHAVMDYDNGVMEIRLQGGLDNNGVEYIQSGMFILSRADDSNNYQTWTKIDDFKLYSQKPSDYLYRDYSVTHGTKYKYSVQQYNVANLYSSRILTPIVMAEFEDMFLYDGDRQLRVRFNPKVTSFKIQIQENKKTTLGAKYPFYFRNGIVEYKEFPISGLISYLSDENEYFMTREELGMNQDFVPTTDLTDENIAYERRFKMQVLEWLNNGEIKLFRSPAEGNYVVRLMNISLSPNDTVNRMLHTFTCTADEVDDCNVANMEKYGFFTTAPEAEITYQFETIQFGTKFRETKLAAGFNARDPRWQNSSQLAAYNHTIATQLADVDLLAGAGCKYIKFEDCLPGMPFILNGETYTVGQTGVYEHHYEIPVYTLKIPDWEASWSTFNGTNDQSQYQYERLRGQVTFAREAEAASKFDDIVGLEIEEIPIANLSISAIQSLDGLYSNIRESINQVHWMRFIPRKTIIDTHMSASNFQNFMNTYLRNLNSVVINDQYVFEDAQGNTYLGSNTEAYNIAKNRYAEITRSRNGLDLCLPDVFYKTTDGRYWRYVLNNSSGGSLITGNPGDTFVYYDIDNRGNEEQIDLSAKTELILGPEVEKPSNLRWGDGVQCEVCLQIRRVTYSIEETNETVRRAKVNYINAKKEMLRLDRGLILLDRNEANTLIPIITEGDTDIYYIWSGEQFYVLSKWDREHWDTSNTEIQAYRYYPYGISEDERSAARATYESTKTTFLAAIETALRQNRS